MWPWPNRTPAAVAVGGLALLLLSCSLYLALYLPCSDCAQLRSAATTTCPQPASTLATLQLTQPALTTRRVPVNFDEKVVFVITPTYTRLTQLLELTRLSTVLQLAAQTVPIHWILVENANTTSKKVKRLVARLDLSIAHLHYNEKRIFNTFKAGGVRNHGIMHVRSLNPHPDSTVYFADDDNVYDPRLFAEILGIKRFGVWPVAFSGGRRVEFCKVNNGQVVGFDAYLMQRRFPLDMAGFALNVRFFTQPTPLLFEMNAPVTTGETKFLETAGVSIQMMEPLADNCRLVYVWHVNTVTPTIASYANNASVFDY